mmetsp:Transcript_19431/g.45217  ORF Transcript_19431/g.45217 Transcript_19431/m.45217 type:complete len:268 (+) Transcript_19431:399-1202(+)
MSHPEESDRREDPSASYQDDGSSGREKEERTELQDRSVEGPPQGDPGVLVEDRFVGDPPRLDPFGDGADRRRGSFSRVSLVRQHRVDADDLEGRQPPRDDVDVPRDLPAILQKLPGSPLRQSVRVPSHGTTRTVKEKTLLVSGRNPPGDPLPSRHRAHDRVADPVPTVRVDGPDGPEKQYVPFAVRKLVVDRADRLRDIAVEALGDDDVVLQHDPVRRVPSFFGDLLPEGPVRQVASDRPPRQQVPGRERDVRAHFVGRQVGSSNGR